MIFVLLKFKLLITFYLKAMETKGSIKFTFEKGTKRPKSMNASSTLFVLYSPERIKIQPGRS